MGGQDLVGPVRLEIPFDPAALPEGVDASQVFLTYFDEERGEWVFGGGEPDLVRNVVVLEVDHGSWWEPATWNWEAWAAALNEILSLNVVSIFRGVAVLADDCPQEGQSVWVDSTGASGLLQGCVERDDAQGPDLRVVNPRAIYVEVELVSGGDYFERTLLAPGESLRFRAGAEGGVPIVVSGDVTQRAGVQLAIHMTIAMLPGFNQLGFQGRTVACLTERVRDISHLVSAAEALLEGNGAAAAERIARLYNDEDAMRRFVSAANECGYGPASTWSIPGIRMIGASLATIQSTVEFVPSFLAAAHGEVAFGWGSGHAGSVEGDGLIVFLGADDFGAATDLRVVEPDGSGLRVLQVDDERPDEFIPLRGRGDCPELSPDGRFLAFGRTTVRSPMGDEELAVLDLSSGEIVGHAGSFGGSFDWSPDGSGIVFDRVVVWTSDGIAPTDPDGLWFFDVSDGSTAMLVPPVEGRSLLHPQWSPEGDWIAFYELAWSPAGSDFFEATWEDTGRFGVSRAGGVGFLILDGLIREFDWSPAEDEIVFGDTVMINLEGL